MRTRIPLLAVLGLLLVPASAAASVDTFHRFEAVATANYTVEEACPDGSTAETLVTVIGGHEEEQENGTTTIDDDFLTLRIRGFDCDFELINDFGTGEGDFRYSRVLDRWSVAGTITTREGSTVNARVRWRGVGRAETDTNKTSFPGFLGLFVSRRRDAVATGTVVVDGQTLVDGSTDNAEMETLEDLNFSWTPPD